MVLLKSAERTRMILLDPVNVGKKNKKCVRRRCTILKVKKGRLLLKPVPPEDALQRRSYAAHVPARR